MEGKQVIGTLQDSIGDLIARTNWQPKDVSGNSTIRFIEAKAMLINAKKKLTDIAKEEGYIEDKQPTD